MLQKTGTLRRLMQAGLLCLAMCALWQAVSPITRQPAQASSSRTDDNARPSRTRPIESIHPGMRVVAGNPEAQGPVEADSPIAPQGWRLFRLRMAKPDGSQLDVALLRPMEWGLAQALERAEQINDQTFGLQRPLTIASSELPLAELLLGKELLLDLPELGASGPATVTAVLPCPDIEAVRGASQRLVTGTFHHSAANVIDLQVASEKEPIGTTDNHPFWSEDRQAFIAAGELQLGETLLLANGTHTQVTRITPHTGPPVEVFNLEVDVDHTYHVGEDGVLVHNAYPLNAAQNRLLGRILDGEDVVVNSIEEARQLLDHTGLRPMNGESMMINQPRLPGTYAGDLLNIENPGANFIHPPGSGPPLHALNPHYNLYFLDRTKSAIIIIPR